jgi:hypothetical protein
VDGGLVHRARCANVLLGRPERDETLLRVAVLALPDDHYFARLSPDTRSVEELAEAARQLTTLLWHDEYGAERDRNLVLDRLEIDVSCGLSRGTPVELRWSRQSRRGNRARFVAEVWKSGSVRQSGVVTVSSRAVSRSAYRRLRAASVTDAEPGAGTGSACPEQERKHG